MPLRNSLLPVCTLFLLITTLAAAIPPEHYIQRYRQALLLNDFTTLTVGMDQTARTQMRERWQAARDSLATNPAYTPAMSILLAPNGELHLQGLLSSFLNERNLAQCQTLLKTCSQKLEQSSADQSIQLTSTDRALVTTLQQMLSNMTHWLTAAAANKPETLNKAAILIRDCCRSLDVPDSKTLQQLQFDDLLTKAGLISKCLKDLAALFNINAQSILESLLVTGEEIDSKHRILSISCTVSKQQYHFTFYMKRSLNSWQIIWPAPISRLPPLLTRSASQP